ncbi:MAG TPA: response regulator transcription factor [Thermoanaerobaculia bacterium]|nr:response regulator transcription factor [Thermoanaerobaculia bacterium]
MTRVAIIDDHPVVREGLVAALERKFEIAGVFSSAEEALQRVDADVILLDLELPGLSGLDAIERLRDRATVLILTAYDAEEDVERAIRAGAKGYLLKGASVEEIERAINMLAQGESYLDPRISAHVMTPRQRLTKREREVIRLVAEGKSNKEIAAKLRITERTVKYHMTSLFNKLGAENRAQAVAIASERHLI